MDVDNARTDGQEVSYQEWQHPDRPNREHDKTGYAKIKKACEIARDHKLEFLWCDTNCINKESSADLSESINSMFAYYADAALCIAYLEDVWVPYIRACRWLMRGWTLQELLAPKHIEFYNGRWKMIGTKSSPETLDILSKQTGINVLYLRNPGNIYKASVAVKMSWASKRTTTRVEDEAYCLLGIFDINMPLLYGEGPKAFIRLQEEIIRHDNDLTIFCWILPSSQDRWILSTESWRGCLAPAPAAFTVQPFVRHSMHPNKSDEFALTNKGIRISLPVRRCVIGNYTIVVLFFRYLDHVDRMTCLVLCEGGKGGIWNRVGLIDLGLDLRQYFQIEELSLEHWRNPNEWRKGTKSARQRGLGVRPGRSGRLGVLLIGTDTERFSLFPTPRWLDESKPAVFSGPVLFLYPVARSSCTLCAWICMRDHDGPCSLRMYFITAFNNHRVSDVWHVSWSTSLPFPLRDGKAWHGPSDGRPWPPEEMNAQKFRKNRQTDPARWEALGSEHEFMIQDGEEGSCTVVRPLPVSFSKFADACDQAFGKVT